MDNLCAKGFKLLAAYWVQKRKKVQIILVFPSCNGILVNVYQLAPWKRKKKAPICSVGRTLWYRYSHHGLAQAAR